MKYKILGIAIIIVMMMGLAIAMTQHEQETADKIGNFWNRLNYFIDKGLFVFTSWGQANCCATDETGYCEQTGDYVGYDEEWTYGTERIDCDDYCSYDRCAIDTWRDIICASGKAGCTHSSSPNWDDYMGEEKGDRAYFRGDVSNMWFFSQIYCCPESCPIEPTHDTKAYRCEDGDWDYKGKYDYEDYCKYDPSGENKCWCADEDDNFYIDESGNVHCRGSPKSGWCVACTSHDKKMCYDNDVYWYDSCGNREEKYDECGALGCEYRKCKTAPIPGISDCEQKSGICRWAGDLYADEIFIGKYDCTLFRKCAKKTADIIESDCELDYCEGLTFPPNGNGIIPNETLPTPSILECKEKEESFYTNAEGTFEAHSFLIGSKEPITPQRIDEYILGFSSKYFELKSDACCKGLEPNYIDTKSTKVTFDILLGLIGGKTADFSYDVYKCVPEGEAGFCLESAHKLLNKYTKTDDCQTNTIILIVIVVLGFIAILKLAG